MNWQGFSRIGPHPTILSTVSDFSGVHILCQVVTNDGYNLVALKIKLFPFDRKN